MRTFLAVEASDAVRAKARKLIAELADCPARVKWVEPDNLHLTLKFFGDVRDDDVSKICDSVGDTVSSVSAFDCEYHGIGAFPHLGRPRTIWVGLQEGHDPMADLQKAIDRALKELRIPRERRAFFPHLTIGRVRDGRDLGKLTDQLRLHIDRSLGAMSVSTVTFFSSQLRPTGPEYTALAHFPLGGA